MLLLTTVFIRFLCLACCSFAYITWHVHKHLSHLLPEHLEKQRLTIIGTISSVVEIDAKQTAGFVFKVSRASDKKHSWILPALVRLNWSHPPKKLLPGDVWELQVKLKRPRNYANPGSFDIERFYLQQRIVASGHVIAKSNNIFITHKIFAAPVNILRQFLLDKTLLYLNNHEFSGVIIALTLGLKNNISNTQQQIFQNLGIAHLLSISGLHIGIICSMMFLILRLLWRYAPSRWLNIAAPWIAAWGALIVSIGYALLAGFSIATQRSLIMVVMFLSGILLKRNTSSAHSYILALLIVVLLEPFAIFNTGFWLSFGAVGLLLYALRGRATKWWQQQLVIIIGLFPITLLFFSQYSLVAPIVNLIAIPWVSFIVLPLGLLGTIFVVVNANVSCILLGLATKSFNILWLIINKLLQVPVYNWPMPENNLLLIITIAIIGVLWIFLPRGLPGRYWGIVGFAPLLFGIIEGTQHGHAKLTLLDVGQGLSVVIQTKNHTLVYDTGAKLSDEFDLGAKVVTPFLRAMGIKKIAMLIISHADNDHIGGAVSLLHYFNTDFILTTAMHELANYNPILCEAGQQWQWDGVMFTMLHPGINSYYEKRNNNSCVLMVQAGAHKVLLTGDIESISERDLIKNYSEELQANIMLVPHHGSTTSSSYEFLKQVNPEYALIPVGYKNQYGHPKPEVLERYNKLNITVLSTDLDGAISFKLGGITLKPSCYKNNFVL